MLIVAAVIVGLAMAELDLTRAAVVIPDPRGDDAERKATQLLVEEVKRRSGVQWPLAGEPPADMPAVILSLRGRGAAEGYSLGVQSGGAPPKVIIEGNDVRGRLFGIGRLLRDLEFAPRRVALDAATRRASAPQVAIRGHQPAWRAKSNSYDAWGKERFEQYLRDLIIFGANALEIIPSIAADDVAASDIMPVDPWEMTLWLAEIARQYGLGVYFWLPIVEDDILTPAGRAGALESRRTLFEACKQIDSVFVPGGDPGHLQPREWFPLMAEQAALLHSIHPSCEMWVSPQNFRFEARDYFYRYLEAERPAWLHGVVHGPWVEDSVQNMRNIVPAQYPLRHYPDICHANRAQYPVPEWDQAFALTHNREPIMPRPVQYAHIHNLFADYAVGFVTYSDGINDDVNKLIWSVMGWDRATDPAQAMVEYGRVYISPEMAADIARGILALERNWQGPAADNALIGETLGHWQNLERRASREVLGNWRFQQMLMRAYYDAYVQARLRFEQDLEREALQALAGAAQRGADAAIADAKAILARADSETPRREWRARIDQLADDLWESIGAQLTVERHHAISWDRGAFVTTLALPLNDRRWIERRLAAVDKADEPAKRDAIRRIVEWEDPGPGGFYDNLGQRWLEPHLVQEPGWQEDPGFVLSAQDEFDYPNDERMSWQCQAMTMFGAPLRLRYQGLDPQAAYKLRITYAGRFHCTTTLVANGSYRVHGPLRQPDPVAPVEFDLPREVTAGGTLELEWQRNSTRGIQVAEVWLIRR